jgi:hypothetical protein
MLLDYNTMLPKLTSVIPNDRRASSQYAAVRCHSVRRARKKPAITIVGQMIAGQTRVFHQQPSGEDRSESIGTFPMGEST